MHPSMKYKLINSNDILEFNTKNTQSLITRGLKLGIFDKNFNLIAGPFDTYIETVKFTGISLGSINKYVNNQKLFKNRCYLSFDSAVDQIDNLDLSFIQSPFNLDLLDPIKVIKSSYKKAIGVKVLDNDFKEINRSPFISLNEASKKLDIPQTTLRRKLNSNKSINNKYFIFTLQ